jgi:hypothetical protein
MIENYGTIEFKSKQNNFYNYFIIIVITLEIPKYKEIIGQSKSK